MRKYLAGLVVALIASALVPELGARPASAASFAPGLTDTIVAGNLGLPTSVAALPDGRMLVTSQEGKLWVVAGGTPSVAVDLAALAKVCSDGEEGLLGVTVDPEFGTNGWVYLYYTARVGGCTLNGAGAGGAKNRVSRFTMSGATVSPATELVLLDNMP